MRVTAYVLAADPVWIEASVLSYYDVVDRIVICYDSSSKGWTGYPIPVSECIERLRAIDRDCKVNLLPGSFYRIGCDPMENDTMQRQVALAEAERDADWVLMIDTDEILPDAGRLLCSLAEVPRDRVAVDWPMRPFFNRTQDGRFLEVTTWGRRQISEYPGPVAARPGARLVNARVTSGPQWRFDIGRMTYDRIDRVSAPSNGVIRPEHAILHLSWIRSEDEVRRKVRSWGHGHQFDGDEYLDRVWRRAARKWMFLYNFHPVWRQLWPALWPVRLPPRLLNNRDATGAATGGALAAG